MKRETVKRVLALLICVWMTVSLLPAVAMAEEVTEDVIDDSTIEAYTSYENGEDAGVSGVSVTDEKPNTDIKVIPSDANALILMDTGAQSPKGVPGQVVKIVLPLAVNKEYLPSEKYMLRNINIYPDVPTDASVSNWPFELIYASDVQHLKDMSYNSTAEVWFEFKISEFASKGRYAVPFKINATVWREDAVNGTTITEDVTFKVSAYVTVTDNGNMRHYLLRQPSGGGYQRGRLLYRTYRHTQSDYLHADPRDQCGRYPDQRDGLSRGLCRAGRVPLRDRFHQFGQVLRLLGQRRGEVSGLHLHGVALCNLWQQVH